MRTTKFRAWDTKRNQWIPADDISVGGDGRIWLNLELLGWVECPAHIILMQFTGLFDKNGVEIWEGDILKDNGVVEWSNDICNEYGCVGFSAVCGGNYSGYSSIKDEVIGNRYEHPELLK